MQNIIQKNLKNLFDGIIRVDLLPEAIRCISVGSRAFVHAVRAFQEAFDLLVDGELGPITMKAMEEQSKPKVMKKKKKEKIEAEDVLGVVDSE